MATVKVEYYDLEIKIGECFKEAFFKDFESSLGRNLTQEEKESFTIDIDRESFDYSIRDLKGMLKPAEDWFGFVQANIQYNGNSQDIVDNFHKWLVDNHFTEEEIEAYMGKNK